MFGSYPPTAIGYPPTAIGYPPTAIGYPPTAIGYPPAAIGYPPTAIGYPPAAIGYPPTAIVGLIGHSEFFFFFITAPPALPMPPPPPHSPPPQVLLNLLGGLGRKHKATLQSPVGDRILLTLNVHTANAGHRAAAGTLLHELHGLWADAKLRARPRVAAAAACGDCLVGTWGPSHALLTDTADLCGALLRAGAEAGSARGVVDHVLYVELKYTFECRMINVMTLLRGNYQAAPSTVCVYELCGPRDPDDGWMHQVSPPAPPPPPPEM